MIGNECKWKLNAPKIKLKTTSNLTLLTYSRCESIRAMSVFGGTAQFNAFAVPDKARTLPLRVWKPCCRRQLLVHLVLFHYLRISLLGVRLLELNFAGEIFHDEFSNSVVVLWLAKCKYGVNLWVNQSSGFECLFKFVQKRVEITTKRCKANSIDCVYTIDSGQLKSSATKINCF